MTYEEFKLLAESLMHQDVLYRKKMKEEDDYPLDTFCYYISEIPMGLCTTTANVFLKECMTVKEN